MLRNIRNIRNIIDLFRTLTDKKTKIVIDKEITDNIVSNLIVNDIKGKFNSHEIKCFTEKRELIHLCSKTTVLEIERMLCSYISNDVCTIVTSYCYSEFECDLIIEIVSLHFSSDYAEFVMSIGEYKFEWRYVAVFVFAPFNVLTNHTNEEVLSLDLAASAPNELKSTNYKNINAIILKDQNEYILETGNISSEILNIRPYSSNMRYGIIKFDNHKKYSFIRQDFSNLNNILKRIKGQLKPNYFYIIESSVCRECYLIKKIPQSNIMSVQIYKYICNQVRIIMKEIYGLRELYG